MNLVVQDDMPLDPMEETLVSYLDGELQGAERAELERQLDQDAGLRSRLQAMQRAWDLLDNLDVVEGSEKFARTTVELVALKTSEDLTKAPAGALRPWRKYTTITAVAVLAAITAYASIRYFSTSEDRKLLQDLPVLEKLDEYQSIPSYDFLKRLEKENIFAEEANHASH